jgi:hypothetical protein
MVRECNTFMNEEEFIRDFDGKGRGKDNNYEDLDISGRVILSRD